MAITDNFVEGLKELLFFGKMCKLPENTTSDEYFNEIAYNIDLTSKIQLLFYFSLELYKVKDVSYYNNKLENAPILLQITNSELVEKYDGYKYLLQVWDTYADNNFEKALMGNHIFLMSHLHL